MMMMMMMMMNDDPLDHHDSTPTGKTARPRAMLYQPNMNRSTTTITLCLIRFVLTALWP